MMKVLRRDLERDHAAAARALALVEQEAPDVDASAGHCWPRWSVYRSTDRHYLNFYGPAGRITTIPFSWLLQDDPSLPDLTNAVVFVGEATPELVKNTEQGDVFRTVYSAGGGRDLSAPRSRRPPRQSADRSRPASDWQRPANRRARVHRADDRPGISIVAGAIRDTRDRSSWCSVLGIGPVPSSQRMRDFCRWLCPWSGSCRWRCFSPCCLVTAPSASRCRESWRPGSGPSS